MTLNQYRMMFYGMTISMLTGQQKAEGVAGEYFFACLRDPNQ